MYTEISEIYTRVVKIKTTCLNGVKIETMFRRCPKRKYFDTLNILTDLKGPKKK